MVLLFFILVGAFLAIIDAKKSVVPDLIILPSIALLGFLKYFYGSLAWSDAVAVVMVMLLFVIPLFLNMEFGGGDIRFGIFCALFLGLPLVGYFVFFSGVLHLLLLGFLRKSSFGFVPAMFLATFLSYEMSLL